MTNTKGVSINATTHRRARMAKNAFVVASPHPPLLHLRDVTPNRERERERR